MIGHLFAQPGLDRIEQVSIDDGGLLASQYLALECDLPNVEAVAKEMSKRTPGKGNAANRFTGSLCSHLGDDAAFAQVCHHKVQAAKPEIAFEDGLDPLGLGFVDGDLAVPGVVAKRRHAADP